MMSIPDADVRTLPGCGVVAYLGAGRLRLFEVLAGGALYVLALLEQVNYYYYQLMYDNSADLR